MTTSLRSCFVFPWQSPTRWWLVPSTPTAWRQLLTGKHNLRNLLFTFTLLSRGVGAARQTKPLPTKQLYFSLCWRSSGSSLIGAWWKLFFHCNPRKGDSKEAFEWKKSLFSVDAGLQVSSAQQSVWKVIYCSNCWNRDINWQIRHQKVKTRQQ